MKDNELRSALLRAGFIEPYNNIYNDIEPGWQIKNLNERLTEMTDVLMGLLIHFGLEIDQDKTIKFKEIDKTKGA
jgi:hypothetical protein